MKFRTTIPLFLLLLLSMITTGQEKVETTNETNLKNALGVGAGFTTGYGLSYRYIPKRFGVQANFTPLKNDTETRFSVGVTFLYRLIETEKTNLYLYQGNHYLYSKEKHPYDYYSYRVPDKVDKYFNNGLGIGIEFIILKRVSFNLMGGYAGYDDFNRIGFTGETGLFFKF